MERLAIVPERQETGPFCVGFTNGRSASGEWSVRAPNDATRPLRDEAERRGVHSRCMGCLRSTSSGGHGEVGGA
jgi:hypothetical protein